MRAPHYSTRTDLLSRRRPRIPLPTRVRRALPVRALNAAAVAVDMLSTNAVGEANNSCLSARTWSQRDRAQPARRRLRTRDQLRDRANHGDLRPHRRCRGDRRGGRKDPLSASKPAAALHVVPHGAGWAVRRERARRASSAHGTRREASLRAHLVVPRRSSSHTHLAGVEGVGRPINGDGVPLCSTHQARRSRPQPKRRRSVAPDE